MPSSPGETGTHQISSPSAHQHAGLTSPVSPLETPHSPPMTASSAVKSSHSTSKGHTASVTGLKTSGQNHATSGHSPIGPNGSHPAFTCLSPPPPAIPPPPSAEGPNHHYLHHSRKAIGYNHSSLTASAVGGTCSPPISPNFSKLIMGEAKSYSPSSSTATTVAGSGTATSMELGSGSHDVPSISPASSYSTAANNSRQIAKLKRLLCTLRQFAAETTPEMGERVHNLIVGLVNASLSIEEFHRKIQETTRYPLRPYVLNFLHLNLPLFQADLVKISRQAKLSLAQYVRQNEGLIFDMSGYQSGPLTNSEPIDIFQTRDLVLMRKDITGKHKLQTETQVRRSESQTNLEDRSSSDGPPSKRQHTIGPLTGLGNGYGLFAPSPLVHSVSVSHPRHAASPKFFHQIPFSRRSVCEDHNGSSSVPVLPYYHHEQTRESSSNRYHVGLSADFYMERPFIVNDVYPEAKDMSHNGRPTALSPLSDEFFRDMDEEWKGIYSMLNHVMGVVDKARKTLAILQHKTLELLSANPMYITPAQNIPSRTNFPPPSLNSSQAGDLRDMKKTRETSLSSMHLAEINNISSEADRSKVKIADVTKASLNGVRTFGLELNRHPTVIDLPKANELTANKRVKMERIIFEARQQAVDDVLASLNRQDGNVENCWNCGRKANETCSGCNLAYYCGSFCQHKDWENHHRTCGLAKEPSFSASHMSTDSVSTATSSATEIRRKRGSSPSLSVESSNQATSVVSDSRDGRDGEG